MTANAWKLMLALLTAEILSAFELSMLYAALRAMIGDFGNPSAVGWVMTSFLLASAVSAAICGRLGDMFGRQRVLLLLAAWIVSELRAESPLLDVRLLANRQVLLVNLGSAMLGISSFQSLQIWSILLQQPPQTGVGLGASATVAGLVLFPQTLIALVAGPTAGWLIAQAVPLERTSEASGMMIVIRSTAMGIGAQIVASLLQTAPGHGDAGSLASYPDQMAYYRVFAYVIVGSLAMISIALLLPAHRRDALASGTKIIGGAH